MKIIKLKKEVMVWVRGDSLYEREAYKIAKIMKFKKEVNYG